jgi:LPXTG-site transpeptidase (sortase) family protein
MAEVQTAVTPAQPEPVRTGRAPRPRRTGWQFVLHWFGILCLMAAVGFAGYVAWALWGTGLSTQRAQTQFRQGWSHAVDSRPASQGATAKPVPLGGRYAEIQIPAIGLDMMVVQGTEYGDLKLGPGHYPDTADPWDAKGRVGIAGHRTTYLHPFFNLDHVRAGDMITLRTVYGTFTYRVNRDAFVIPEVGSGSVLRQTKEPTLVLTTCNPRYQSYERLIVTADRVSG